MLLEVLLLLRSPALTSHALGENWDFCVPQSWGLLNKAGNDDRVHLNGPHTETKLSCEE